MSFFDDLPAPPVRPRQPKLSVPPWAAPPSDELPAVVPLGLFLQRSQRMVMAVKGAEVYSTGCLLEVVWTIRRGAESDAEWGAVTERCFNRPSFRYGTQGGGGGGFRLGVAYPDGGKGHGRRVAPVGDRRRRPGGGAGADKRRRRRRVRQR